MFRNKINLNLIYAEYGLQYAQQRFPLGGLNRKDVYDTNPIEVNAQLKVLDDLREKIKCDIPNFSIMDQCIDQLKGGFCGELSFYVRAAILEKYPQACVEVASFPGIHQLLAIGRKSGDLTDVKTWGEGYFLDVWAKEIYPFSFLHKKQNGPSIPFYLFNGNDKTLCTQHYLSGNPEILTCTFAACKY